MEGKPDNVVEVKAEAPETSTGETKTTTAFIIEDRPVAAAPTAPPTTLDVLKDIKVTKLPLGLPPPQTKKTSGGNRRVCPGYNKVCTEILIGYDLCYVCTMAKNGIIVGRGGKNIGNGEFIRRSTIMHRGRYLYPRCYYINNKKKVIITCSNHGDFEQLPSNHLRGNGCSKCGMHQHDTEEFVNAASVLHNGKYIYTHVAYINNTTEVTIGCPDHGWFQQTPNSHLNGRGCNECGRERTTAASTKTLEHFLQRAAESHPPGKYAYPRAVYLGYNVTIEIHCNTCGRDFWQTPDAHCAKKGCSHCNKSKLANKVTDYLISVEIGFILEKSFDDCRDIRPLPFDVYVHKYDMLIELDGEQHFTVAPGYMGGDEGYAKRLRHDNMKDEWVRKNKRILLRISYVDFDDIEDIITSAIWFIEHAPGYNNTVGYIMCTKFYLTFTDRNTSEYKNIW
jgi:hypothetical protein